VTEKPCAFFASYVDAKFMRGLKVMRISLDIPIEKSNEFLTAFGAPNAADPVPCAIARLNPEKALTRHENGPVTRGPEAEPAPAVEAECPHADKGKGSDKPRTYTRSQIAALKLQDEGFQIWLAETYPQIWDRHYIDGGHMSPEAADLTLKEALGISSKRELDTSPEKGEAFDKLLTDFDTRGYTR